MHRSTKTYTHAEGLSCCFRQWRAEDSHCHFLHGYALKIQLTFSASSLDERNWVMDFGGLKKVKAYLHELFDHKLLVARDDPARDHLLDLQQMGLAQVELVDATGCEAFAELVYRRITNWLWNEGHTPRVQLDKVEIWEHEANSAVYEP